MSDKKLKKDSANPALAPKERKIKELQSKIDAGTYKPDPAKIADKMVEGAKKEKTMKKDEMKGEPSEPGDMQMSENAKCKQCGKGEKLCKCAGMMKTADLCKKCGGEHSLAKCALGKSYNQMKDLEKARVDEGKDLEGKVRARQVRNDRDVKTTKTPTGQNTRTSKTSYKRMKELEVGAAKESNFDAQGRAQNVRGIPAERRKGEKIVGTPRTMQNETQMPGQSSEEAYGVHMHSGTMAGKKLAIGDSAPVTADKQGKSYRVGGAYGDNSFSSKIRHDQVMSGQSKIKPMLKAEHKPGMSLNDLKKAEQGLMKAEAEAVSLAAEARAALNAVRAKLDFSLSKADNSSMSPKQKIHIAGYPKDIHLETDAKLPAFKSGCPARTKIARDAISKEKHSAPHSPEDFIVEHVEKTKDGEKWHLGS